MQASGAFVTINTKSDLVLSDIDLISNIPGITVCFTVNCLDEWFLDLIEAAPQPCQRIRAMESLHSRGVRVGCYIAPAMPGITNVGAILKAVRDYCDFVWIDPLNFRSGGYGAFTGLLSVEASHLLPLYKEIYGRKDYTHWINNSKALKEYCLRHGYIYHTSDVKYSIEHSSSLVVIDNIAASLSKGLV